jgi:hypothetical protein
MTDRSGYHPYVAHTDSGQILVSIFTNEDGSIDTVDLAFRDDDWDSWSPPTKAGKSG